MENNLSLVREGKTITHHFGWQDFNDLATKTTPLALTLADTWYDLPNDGLGPNTNLGHKIYDHGNIWNTSTDSFDFSSLKLGDLLLVRFSAYITTSSSNVGMGGKLRVAIGSDIEYDIPFFQGVIKHSGRHLLSVTSFVYMGNEETLNNPAKVAALSDATGTTVEVDGWAVATLARS